MTPAAIIAEIDRRQNQHLADIETIRNRLATHEEAWKRRARDEAAHVDAITALESIKTFIIKNTPAQPMNALTFKRLGRSDGEVIDKDGNRIDYAHGRQAVWDMRVRHGLIPDEKSATNTGTENLPTGLEEK